MTGQARLTGHIVAAVLSLVVAVFLVHCNNRQYWQDRPYPGDRTAREAAEDSPRLEPGTHRLIRAYSLPLGFIAFAAFYGAAAALFEVRNSIKYPMAVAFLYVIPAFMISWFVIPLFIGAVLALLLLISAATKKCKRATWFSCWALAHNVFFAIITFRHMNDWFEVFGD